jgi:hypothetical protein
MNSREATIHLVLLGIYADNALTEPEDSMIDKMMTRLGWESDADIRTAFVSQAFATIQGMSGNDEVIADFLSTTIKPALPAVADKEMALAELEWVVNRDGHKAASENSLLRLAGWILK